MVSEGEKLGNTKTQRWFYMRGVLRRKDFIVDKIFSLADCAD